MTTPLTLRDRVAVVTGASGGIGEALALMLAEEGASVALAGRRAEELDRVGARIAAAGGRAITIPTDVRRDDDLAALLARTERELGPVDVLVNNAGIAGSSVDLTPFHEVAVEEWDAVLAVNLRAAVLLCRAVVPGMLGRGRGWIVNLASEAGAYVYPGMGAYAVSKHALRVLTELIDAEYGERGITAWAICPGLVETPMGAAEHPTYPERALTTDDVAEVVRNLLRARANVKLGPVILVRPTRNPFAPSDE